MTGNDKMICDCGAEMNFHAEKINRSLTAKTGEFTEVVEEIHTCPSCSAIKTRIAE